MQVLSFVSQKGGTGKTCLALSIAVCAAEAGRSVLLVDLDPQVSACAWADMRADKETLAVLDAQPARLPQLIEKARGQGIDLVIIDTAGRTEQAALEAARAASLVIIPVQPSAADLKTVQATCTLLAVAGSPPSFAVLTRVKPVGGRHEEARQFLVEDGVAVAPVTIGDRVTFQDAYAAGQGVSEYDPGSKATQEIRELYNYTNLFLDNQTGRTKAHGSTQSRRTA